MYDVFYKRIGDIISKIMDVPLPPPPHTHTLSLSLCLCVTSPMDEDPIYTGSVIPSMRGLCRGD